MSYTSCGLPTDRDVAVERLDASPKKNKKETHAPFSGAGEGIGVPVSKNRKRRLEKKCLRETRVSSTHLVPPLGVVPVLVPEVQRLDILRRLVRHLER